MFTFPDGRTSEIGSPCQGCSVFVHQDNAMWYGRWVLCGDCKARSVCRGWLPSDAKRADHAALNRDVVELNNPQNMEQK